MNPETATIFPLLRSARPQESKKAERCHRKRQLHGTNQTHVQILTLSLTSGDGQSTFSEVQLLGHRNEETA